MDRKQYSAPTVKSFTIQEPLAFACNVYNMNDCCEGGQWSGLNLFTDPHINC